MTHIEFMNYIQEIVVDELTLRGHDLYDDEIESVKEFITDNDTDIINTALDAIFDEYLNDYIEELVENRTKIYEVEIIRTMRRVLYIKANDESDIKNAIYYDENEDIAWEVEQNGEVETEFYVLNEYDTTDATKKFDVDLT